MHRKPVPPLSHADHDAGGPVSRANRLDLRQRAQAGHRKTAGLVFADVAQNGVAELRFPMQALDYFGENARVPEQEDLFRPERSNDVVPEEDPPDRQNDDDQQAAHHHQPASQDKLRLQIAEECHQEQGASHCQTDLLR